MNKVTVFNLNQYPLHELFKGQEVLIEAQDYWRDKKGKIREIDVYEAAEFKGQYHPVPFDGSGKMINDAKYFKMLKIEPVSQIDTSLDKDAMPAFKCMAKECKHVSASAEELETHTTVRHPDVERLVLPEEDQAIRSKQQAKKKSA